MRSSVQSKSRTTSWGMVVAAGVLTLAAGCGGSGHGYSVDTDPVVLESLSLPSLLSGQEVHYAIPYHGGRGGPFLLEVIAGRLPEGVEADSETVSLEGVLLVDGTFDFTLKLTDTSTQPFSTTTGDFHWVVGKGPVTFVSKPLLPDMAFAKLDSIQLQVAGGTGPYACRVVDDPMNPNDEDLPDGLTVLSDSTTIFGAPQEGKPGASPFVFFVTIEAYDHANDTAYPTPGLARRTFELRITTPEIHVGEGVADGICGTAYSGFVSVSGGIPPFHFEIVDAAGSFTKRVGEPGTPSGTAKNTGLSAYASDAAVGPYANKFPEGLFLREASGAIGGTPRRTGLFNGWIVHVNSTTLPSDASQQKWRSMSFTMADAAPPALILDPAALAPGNNSFAAGGANKIAELEVSIRTTLQFKGIGGVRRDGNFDAPHDSQQTFSPTEPAGTYSFLGTAFPAGEPLAAGMTFDLNTGLLDGTPTKRSDYRRIQLKCTDAQLPTPTQHVVTGEVRYSVGPDLLVVTESLSGTSSSFTDATFDIYTQTVEMFEPFAVGPTVRAPSDSKDMTATHTIPIGGKTLASLLSNVDILRVSVNPTTRYDDNYGLNAKGARPWQRADTERRTTLDAISSDTFMKVVAGVTGAQDFAPNSGIELPETPALAHDPASGIYNNGGVLYGFDSSTAFGFFVVRKDSLLYVPVAFAKGTYQGFGDCWVSSTQSASGQVRRPQISVSPDGRFAVVKLKRGVNSGDFLESSTLSELVLFSLTGEKPFAGTTYKQVGSGNTAGSTQGQYLYADSLALTNRHLYYVMGNFTGVDAVYRDHWVYRYEIASSATAGALLPGPSGSTVWTATANTSANPLSVTWHRWANPGAASIFNADTFQPSRGSGTGSVPAPDFFAFNWANFAENSTAPTPFRVSVDGKACVIVANALASGTTTGTNVMSYGIFVDYDGTFRQVSSSTTRRFRGASRVGGLHYGEELNQMYGWFDGPATQLEVSDDGKRIAAVYNASTASWGQTGNANATLAREDIAFYSAPTPASTTDPWAGSVTETLVTPTIWAGGYTWRFGSLAFTRDNKALVFWGGYSISNASATGSGSQYDIESVMQAGTLYNYDFTAGTYTSILPNADGGGSDGVKSYSTSATVSPGNANYAGNQGATAPIGAFYSSDGNFYWLQCYAALSSTNATPHRLVGVNVSANASNTINGRTAGRAFAPAWSTNRGFGPRGYVYYAVLACRSGIGVSGSRGGTMQVTAPGTNGLVFYGSYLNATSTTASDSNASSFSSAAGPVHPTAWGDYGAYQGQVYGIDTAVGGSPFALTNLTGSYRHILHLQPNRSGTRVAFIYSDTSSSTYHHDSTKETVSVITNIATNTAGALSSVPTVVTLDGPGRAGLGIVHDPTDNKVYYSYVGGSGTNENQMLLVEKTLNAAGTAVSATRTIGGALGGAGGQARFCVLNAGR